MLTCYLFKVFVESLNSQDIQYWYDCKAESNCTLSFGDPTIYKSHWVLLSASLPIASLRYSLFELTSVVWLGAVLLLWVLGADSLWSRSPLLGSLFEHDCLATAASSSDQLPWWGSNPLAFASRWGDLLCSLVWRNRSHNDSFSSTGLQHLKDDDPKLLSCQAQAEGEPYLRI